LAERNAALTAEVLAEKGEAKLFPEETLYRRSVSSRVLPSTSLRIAEIEVLRAPDFIPGAGWQFPYDIHRNKRTKRCPLYLARSQYEVDKEGSATLLATTRLPDCRPIAILSDNTK
jgi:hypothetical protein